MIYGTPPDPFWTALNGTVISQYQGLTASPLEDLVLRSPTRAKGVIDRAFGDLSMPDEWVDEITITGFKQYSRNILLGRFGIGIEIDSFDLDANETTPYLPKAGELAMVARWYWVRKVRALLNQGATTALGTWYDGKAFFAADHVLGDSGEFSNIITGSGKTPAAMDADLGTARARMAGFKNDQGEPQIVAYEPDTILYDATDEDLQTSLDVLLLGAIILGQPNWRPRIKQVIPDPGLDGTGKWYPVCTTKPQKPFIIYPGIRGARAGETDVADSGDGWVEVVYEAKKSPEWTYLWKMRAGYAYGDPRTILQVDNSGGGS